MDGLVGLAYELTDTSLPSPKSPTWCSPHRPTSVDEAKPNFVPDLMYRKSGVKRAPLTPEQVPWTVTLAGYNPVEFTDNKVIGAIWADPPSPKGIKFNGFADGVDRTTLHRSGHYDVTSSGRPLNPNGRTGMTGRGELGKWG